MIYLDSSALVKKYLMEDGSEKVKTILDASDVFATSKITYPEVLSAFARKYRHKDISENKFQRASEDFQADWDYLCIVEFQDEMLPVTREIIETHYLKGADSIHLSSALWLKGIFKDNLIFVSSDVNLLKAAKDEELDIINP
ncbi:MAG: type II toxin-antitoxin system VapC family toxin [Nitrospirota bacterium]|jgi:predicted nucleic acid-binding protein